VNHYQLLASRLPEDKLAEFREIVNKAQRKDLSELDDSFLGFIEDYVDIAAILERHTIRFPKSKSPRIFVEDRSWKVYDIGCAEGFQHVLFSFADEYIGVDSHFWGDPPVAVIPNARFVHGRFAEIADSLRIDRRRSFGIANMSLAYLGREDDIAAFDRLFLHKFVI